MRILCCDFLPSTYLGSAQPTRHAYAAQNTWQCHGHAVTTRRAFEFTRSRVGALGHRPNLDVSPSNHVFLIKQILIYLEMIFGKNKEQTTRHLQFKFYPLPAELTGICLFHQRWIKNFDTQPFFQLCIKYVQYFIRLIRCIFATNIWQVLHKKTHFEHLENGKCIFREKKMKTPLGNIFWNSNMHPCAQYAII